MNNPPPLDLKLAHRYFSTTCFNKTWEWLDKTDRTAADNERMIACAYASMHHWFERDDLTAKELSVGSWLLARVFAVADRAEEAWHHGRMCEEISRDLAPFYRGYAQEALARAALRKNDYAAAMLHLQEAEKFLVDIQQEDEKSLLASDLAALRAQM